jgi:hypothetical protein
MNQRSLVVAMSQRMEAGGLPLHPGIRGLDSIHTSRNNENGVAYAEPPWVVPSTILDGGKGTSVSGRRPGPFVSGVVAGGFRP